MYYLKFESEIWLFYKGFLEISYFFVLEVQFFKNILQTAQELHYIAKKVRMKFAWLSTYCCFSLKHSLIKGIFTGLER